MDMIPGSFTDDVDDVVRIESILVGDSPLDKLDGVLIGKIPDDVDSKEIKEIRLMEDANL